MTIIYHNPRCRKSRETLEIISQKEEKFEIIEYLKNPLSKSEIVEVLFLLKMNPIDLIRKNEEEWKNEFKGKDLSDDQIIEAMVNFPKLIERPIVIKGKNAVIGRPPIKVLDII
jgi:arsenate reductase